MYTHAERLEWPKLSVKAGGHYTCSVRWPNATEEQLTKTLEIESKSHHLNDNFLTDR